MAKTSVAHASKGSDRELMLRLVGLGLEVAVADVGTLTFILGLANLAQ